MREALSLLDFEDDSISDVRALLVRAAFAPAFLKAPEGRRFLSYLFTLQAWLSAARTSSYLGTLGPEQSVWHFR